MSPTQSTTSTTESAAEAVLAAPLSAIQRLSDLQATVEQERDAVAKDLAATYQPRWDQFARVYLRNFTQNYFSRVGAEKESFHSPSAEFFKKAMWVSFLDRPLLPEPTIEELSAKGGLLVFLRWILSFNCCVDILGVRAETFPFLQGNTSKYLHFHSCSMSPELDAPQDGLSETLQDQEKRFFSDAYLELLVRRQRLALLANYSEAEILQECQRRKIVGRPIVLLDDALSAPDAPTLPGSLWNSLGGGGAKVNPVRGETLDALMASFVDSWSEEDRRRWARQIYASSSNVAFLAEMAKGRSRPELRHCFHTQILTAAELPSALTELIALVPRAQVVESFCKFFALSPSLFGAALVDAPPKPLSLSALAE